MKNLIISAALILSSLSSLASFSQVAPKTEQTRQKCAGITAKGTQCSNFGKPTHCHLHSPDAVKCSGTTVKGEKCKSPVKKGETACFRHKA